MPENRYASEINWLLFPRQALWGVFQGPFKGFQVKFLRPRTFTWAAKSHILKGVLLIFQGFPGFGKGKRAKTMSGPKQPNRPPVDIDDNDPATGIAVKSRTKTKKPAMYKVLMLNDDYTPMEFVVHVLEQFFKKTADEATRIMLHVHQRGLGVCGVFTYEVAETKVGQVMDLARKHQHPLQCTIEKDDGGE